MKLLSLLFATTLFALTGFSQSLDWEAYDPPSTLKVAENPVTKAKYPFIDVHNHQFGMPDQDLWRFVRLAQPAGCRNQILYIGGETGIGELALAVAQPGEVEAQHTEPQVGERVGDARRGSDVLATGEAMGEQRKGPRWPRRQVEPSGQLGPLTPREGDSVDACGHGGDGTPTTIAPDVRRLLPDPLMRAGT